MARPRVLIVEDDPTVSALLVRVLRDRCDVLVADSVERGIARVEAERFDLVICDQHFPEGGSGVDVARRARAHDPAARVLLISAVPAPLSDEDRQALGVLDSLSKPFVDLKALRALIDRALSGRA